MKIVSAEILISSVGQEIGVSEWFEMTQDKVNMFADVTHDHQFIHIDQEKAAQTPFGGTIAHGFYTLSLLSHFAETGAGIAVEGTKMGVNYGFDKVRFINPVPVGARIRSRSVLKDVQEKQAGQFLISCSVSVEIENSDKPALVADWLSMVIV